MIGWGKTGRENQSKTKELMEKRTTLSQTENDSTEVVKEAFFYFVGSNIWFIKKKKNRSAVEVRLLLWMMVITTSTQKKFGRVFLDELFDGRTHAKHVSVTC